MTGNTADIEVLRHVSIFSSLNEKHLKAIFKACTQRDFEPGEALVEQGASGIGMFIILSGKVVVQKTKKDGDIITIAEHGPSEVIGELSILDGAPRSATVSAKEKTSCLVLSSWSFQSILEAHPTVAAGILPIIVKRFRETNDALLSARGE